MRPNSASRSNFQFNQGRRFFNRDRHVFFQPFIWPTYWYPYGDLNDYSYLDEPDDTAVTASEASADLNYEDAVPYTLVDTISLSSGGTITVDCTTENGTAGAELEFNTLVATAVDAIN